MALPTSLLLRLPWRLVLQAALFVAVALGGTVLLTRLQYAEIAALLRLVLAQNASVVQATHEVRDHTEALQQQMTTAVTTVQANNTILEHHQDLSHENLAMYQHLVPLFDDIVARQHQILQGGARMQAQCEQLLQQLQASPQPRKEPE